MKCFSIFEGSIFPGIEARARWTYDQKFGQKRKRYFVKVGRGSEIPFFFKNPPQVEKGTIYEAFPLKITRGRTFYVLAKPNERNDKKALVHILSESPWEVEDGRPRIIARCEYVEAARCRREWKRWYSGLVVLREGGNDAIRVELEEGPAVIWYEDGELWYELLQPAADAMEPEIGSSPELHADLPSDVDPYTGYPGFAPVRIEDVLYDK